MSDAANEYRRMRAECDLAIVRLQLALSNHAARQAGHPDWWTYVGDVKKARVELLQLASFLGDGEAREVLFSEGVER
jgi:hypothetical protein